MSIAEYWAHSRHSKRCWVNGTTFLKIPSSEWSISRKRGQCVVSVKSRVYISRWKRITISCIMNESCRILNCIYSKNTFETCDHLFECSLKRDHAGNFFKILVPEKMKVSLRQFISGC